MARGQVPNRESCRFRLDVIILCPLIFLAFATTTVMAFASDVGPLESVVRGSVLYVSG